MRMIRSRNYSKMCLCRYLIVILLVPVVVHSAEWKGKWFPVNPHLRMSLPTEGGEVSSSTTSPSTTATIQSSSSVDSIPFTGSLSSNATENAPVTPSVADSSPSVEVSPSTEASVPSSSVDSISSTDSPSSTTTEGVVSSPVPETPLPADSSRPTEAPPPITSSTSRPSSTTVEKATEASIFDLWTGLWFPVKPGSIVTASTDVEKESNHSMGEPDIACDNAKDNLGMDFDPVNIVDSVVYVCFGQKHLYNPNTTIEPILKEHVISPAYKPQHKCMDTEIKYGSGIPTFGDHRPLWAKYGEFKYVPSQRWLHNIEHGAIVMLYHPCANFNQVEQLKLLVKNCLYRHVITTNSEYLTPERPLALVAWGKSLEMSVVVPEIVVNFIRDNALRGSEKSLSNGQYEKLLINHADIVSTVDDSVLCPNNGQLSII